MTAPIRARLAQRLERGETVLGEGELRELLADELPFGPALACERPSDVGPAALALGVPVVVKALSAALPHKSDHGLVRTGCHSAEAAEAAAAELLERVRALGPEIAPTLSVQRQLDGVELALGVRRDALGAVVMVSAGGALIELLDDVALAIAPVDRAQALRMLRGLRIAPRFDGYRGEAAVDVDALADLVVSVSQLAVAVPELAELDLNPVFASAQGCRVADALCRLQAPPARPARTTALGEGVRELFAPRRIAIVGAIGGPRKVGSLILRYLRKHEWTGTIAAVTRDPLQLAGVETYARVTEIDGGADLACIAVPAAAVPQVIEDCISAGIPAGIVFSAGFAESGEAGAEAQRRIVASAAGRFRFVGPNSLGVAVPGERMFATFGMSLEADELPAGNVALVSQSGAIASALISRSAEFGVGFSHWISCGNEADLDVADFIAHLAEDERAAVICLFLEQVRDPEAFVEACERARAAGKPVIALKAGRSEGGRAAALSHTGALSGSDRAYDAFLERCSVLQVRSLPALLCAAQGLLGIGPLAGARAAVVSMSGGACSLLADACADAGLAVDAFSEATQAELRALLPDFGGSRNPVDITAVGIGSPQLVRSTVELIRASGEVDVILLQLSTNADPAAAEMAADLVQERDRPGAPFLVGRLGAPALAPAAMAVYGQAGMHVFAWPDQLVEAARACVAAGRLLAADAVSGRAA